MARPCWSKNSAAIFYAPAHKYATFDASTVEARICRIFRVSPDGSSWEKVMDFPDPLTEFYIHRGYLYTIQKIEEKDTLCRYSLTDRKHPEEILYQSQRDDQPLRSLRLNGNRVYFEQLRLVDEKNNDITYCYHLNTKELTIPIPQEENESLSFYAALGDHLFYRKISQFADFPENDNPRDLDLYQCDLDGKNPRVVLTGKKTYYALVDQNYIFEVQMEYRKDKQGNAPQNQLIVYDHEGNQLAQYPMEEIGDPTSDYVAGDEAYLYVYSGSGIYKIDKEKLAEGQLEKKPVLELASSIASPNIYFQSNQAP